ncbi:MAG: hypothetical protein QM731_10700 [Chitinophagaceae bacterium]
MIFNQPLEINILYYSDEGRESRFSDIQNNIDCLDIEDYETESFWSLMGGFEVTVNGFNTIFHNSNFHYLTKATSFLIQSLYWIKNEPSEWFAKEDIFPNQISLRSTGNNIVRLQEHNEHELIFSYTPAKERTPQRGDRFFNGVVLNKQEWFKQTDIALGEYFNVLRYVLKTNSCNNISENMFEYYESWHTVSAEHSGISVNSE